jgi:hypothetical protein
MKKIKIIIISLIFYIIGILITWWMFNLWFWLFDSKFWQTTFVIITLFGSMKYFWQHTGWTIEKLQNK